MGRTREVDDVGNRSSRAPRSDALVLFGVTGELAHKMIFPALYAMAKRDALTVPVIGVASSQWGDAMVGDGALFTREDAVEAAWAVVDRVLKTHHRARPYRRGRWGPKAADALIASNGPWHNPTPERTRA